LYSTVAYYGVGERLLKKSVTESQ